ncbi:MAG TPA: hypothetical protein VNA14_02330 [Mycobacteriales bacterium]|nr:hypothetical protein [Mycobacteriales bacterium]
MRAPNTRHVAGANLVALLAGVLALVTAAPAGIARTAADTDPRLSAAAAARRLGDPDFMRGDSAGLLAPGDWFDRQRAGADGQVDPAAYAAALTQAERLRADTARRDPVLAGAPWQLMGPTNVGGRVLDLAVDATQDDTLYIAAATGGVWKSVDAGLTYTPSWPANQTQSVGALAVGRDGTLYAGTGEAGPGGGSVTFAGNGIYRSRDKGRTWQNVGLRGAGAFGKIVVDPKNPKIVFAAATGNLFTQGGQRGLYRSTDGGNSWQLVLRGANARTGAVDIAIDPTDPRKVYATTWDRIRYPTHRVYGGPGSGVYRSVNGGTTWQRVVDGPTGETPADTGRIAISVAASQPKRLYAHVIATNGVHAGFFRSDDAGVTWIDVPIAATIAGNASSYGWWFGRIFVDPKDANRLFVPGVDLVESRDGGLTAIPHSNTTAGVVAGFTPIGNPHADQHAMVWHPRVANRVYLANDGGMYTSRANGLPGTWVGGLSQGWTQHYSVGVSRQQPGRIVTGLQDNLCQRSYLVGGVTRPDSWTKYGLCGDGLQTLINPDNDLVVYGCSQYGSCTRSDDGGFSFRPLGATQSDRRGWWTPLQFDPSDPNVMYYGGNVLNRSTDGGLTWTAISDDLSTDPEQLDEGGYQIYGVITWVAASPSDPNRLIVGTDEGLIWTTTDLGETWRRASAPKVTPKAWITRVGFDPKNANVVYATYSGYRSGSNRAHVMRSTNFGRTWTDITGNLPVAPVNEIITVGSGTLIVGTDVGVFLSRDAGRRWLAVGKGLPTVPILDLEFDRASDTLTAATFGRGIMRVTLPDL